MHPIQHLRKASIEAANRPARQLMQAAHDAPRCQHIRWNGQRCAAPALREQTLCYFHYRAEDPATYDERWLPLIEDATSLKSDLTRVHRLMLMDGIEFKRATAQRYSLQIACMNLKNLQAEQSTSESGEGDRSGNMEKTGHNGDLPALSALLARLLAERGNGHRKAPASSRASTTARTTRPVEERQGPSRALPSESAPGMARGS